MYFKQPIPSNQETKNWVLKYTQFKASKQEFSHLGKPKKPKRKKEKTKKPGSCGESCSGAGGQSRRGNHHRYCHGRGDWTCPSSCEARASLTRLQAAAL